MQDTTAIHNTFVIERDYPVAPERVFAAFADPARKRRWFAESGGHIVEAFEMDFRVGGNQHVRIRFGEHTPIPGALITSDTSHQDIVENRRIVVASNMSLSGKRISVSLETFEFLPTPEGTNLIMTNQAVFFEGADGPAMRQDGWRKLLERLAGELAGA